MYLSDLADSLEALALSVTLPQAAGVATSFHVRTPTPGHGAARRAALPLRFLPLALRFPTSPGARREASATRTLEDRLRGALRPLG